MTIYMNDKCGPTQFAIFLLRFDCITTRAYLI